MITDPWVEDRTLQPRAGFDLDLDRGPRQVP